MFQKPRSSHMHRFDFNQQTKKFPKFYHCRDFKNFSDQQFGTELIKELNGNNAGANQFELFQTITLGLLNKLAPSKKKTLWNN